MRLRFLAWLPSVLVLLSASPEAVAGEPAQSPSVVPAEKVSKAKRKPAARPRGPVVERPGFSLKEGGGSQLLVHVSERVPVEERREKHRLIYVLRGVSARTRNTLRPLETQHFRTPVLRAHLVPKGADLWFIVELRSDAAATWQLTDAADKSVTLTVDFAALSDADAAKIGPKETSQPKPKAEPAPEPAEGEDDH
jgi:hypothetical protein